MSAPANPQNPISPTTEPGTSEPYAGSTTTTREDGSLGLSDRPFRTDPTSIGLIAELGSLANRFVVPPFTVLDTRQGYWLDRREQWKALGIKSELGRAGDALGLKVSSDRQKMYKAGSSALGTMRGANASAYAASSYESGTSIFDPVLCEAVYRWFTVAGDSVLDPFAGGSVRGIVAGVLGRRYYGVELRGEQVRANDDQAYRLRHHFPDDMAVPQWVQGDSLMLEEYVPEWEQPFELVFTCPPYYDLEVYSDDPSDLSNAPSYEEFRGAYECILQAAADMLLQDCFMVIVVSEIRDKTTGVYRGFVHDTVQAVQGAGLTYYNHAVLLNSAGSLPIRAAKHFAAGRKLGKCHQDILVFCKGSPQAAARRIGEPDTQTNALPSPQLSIEV